MSSNESRVVYQRELPGGGFVHVEEEGLGNTETRRAVVTVERRTDPTRRDGHEPPVIASAEGRSQGVFGELLRIAQDNVAIAKGLLRLRGDGKAKF